LIVTKATSLIVANADADSLNLYFGAESVDGNQAPQFVVEGVSTLLDRPTSMAYDAGGGWVFVLNGGSNTDILVFPGPSQVVFDGDLAPVRVISSTALIAPTDIVLDAADNLYVANNGARNVLVFEDASELDGDAAPTRTVTSASFLDPFGVFVDRFNRLYVVERGGQVLMFDNAAGLDGTVAPSRTVIVSGVQSLTAVVVDDMNTGYVLDVDADALYSFANLPSLSGTVAPDRIVQGGSTELSRPVRMFLLEK
jgi:hypothetical protein